MQERFIHVQRNARYHVLGDIRSAKAIWIVVHGYGQLARFFLNNFNEVGGDICVVAPEGLNRFYLDADHSRVGATWMTREDRLHEIEDHVAYLDQLVTALKKETPIGVPVNAFGYSQGVATVARWSIKGKTQIERMIFWGGGLPQEIDREMMQKWSAIQFDLVLGDQDQYQKEIDLRTMAQRLTSAGVANRMHLFKGGHSIEKMLLGRLLK
ncbi:MAG: phospholipase [Bacteroidota bacterium]|nr:phospholipase [Bacteroidota bacterium]